MEATAKTIARDSDRRRWIALFVVCLGQLMIILDTTIVNVALPSIQSDLHFSQPSLTSVIDGGASLGLLLGGVLTETINWHWIFFVNLPIGAVAYFLGRRLIAENEGIAAGERIDWLGSVLITASSIALIYALIKIPEWGWTGGRTLGLAGISALLLAAFVGLESRIANPIMPLRVLGLRSLVTSNLVRGFLVTGAYSTFFLGSLYFQHVRGWSPIEIGLAFMAMSLALATMSSGLAARLVERFGPKRTLVAGIAGPVAGLLLFSQVGVSTPYFPAIFAAFALLGFGFGAANPPLMMIAMEDVPTKDAGLASGTIQVSIQLSAAIGLAALGTIATDRTNSLESAGESVTSALSGGYHLAFLIAAGAAAVGILIALLALRAPTPQRVAAEIDEGAPVGLEAEGELRQAAEAS